MMLSKSLKTTKGNNKMITPTKYDIERIQLIALLAYNVFDGTGKSVDYLMRDMAVFYTTFAETMEEAEKVIVTQEDSNSEVANALAIVALCFKGLDALLTHNSHELYDLAKEMLRDIDIEKDYTPAMRNHIFAEMQLRAAA